MNLNIILRVVLLLVLMTSLVQANCDRVLMDLTAFDLEIKTLQQEFESFPVDPLNTFWVTQKIESMVDIDQHLREVVMNLPADQNYDEDEKQCFWHEIGPRWEKIDGTNTEDLKSLMKLYPWFYISKFGEEVAENAWLLAQHADRDRAFQRVVLQILEKAYPEGEVKPKHYAYLYDRVTWYGDNRPQRYATQGRCLTKGDWQPWPIENPSAVDGLRAAMGFDSFQQNKSKLDRVCR